MRIPARMELILSWSNTLVFRRSDKRDKEVPPALVGDIHLIPSRKVSFLSVDGLGSQHHASVLLSDSQYYRATGAPGGSLGEVL